MSNNNQVIVYLPYKGSEKSLLRNELALVLERAGMKVLPSQNDVGNEELSEQFIKQSDCSIHILHPKTLEVIDDKTQTLLAKTQFYESKKHLEVNSDYKIIVWQPIPVDDSFHATELDFINEVRNNVSKNMVYSTVFSSIQLVDDIRSLMETKTIASYDLNSTDIFLISNQLDDISANEISDMLSDIVPVEKLNIIQDSDIDYSELCKQQISKSKLAVVYYKDSTDWAIPFAQQVWKKIGGASSHTPILLIGDEDPNLDDNRKFNAPKVISLIVAGELIPLEIKVQFDKLIETK